MATFEKVPIKNHTLTYTPTTWNEAKTTRRVVMEPKRPEGSFWLLASLLDPSH